MSVRRIKENLTKTKPSIGNLKACLSIFLSLSLGERDLELMRDSLVTTIDRISSENEFNIQDRRESFCDREWL